MSPVRQIAATLPEPKLQSIKKKVRPVSSATPRPISSGAPASQMSIGAATAAKPAHIEAPKKVEVVKKKDKAKDKKKTLSLVSFWPVFLGIFLSGYVSQWQTMASQLGVWGMRLAFPLTLLATHREIGIDSQMTAILPQAALYGQLPLEGLLMTLMLARGKSLKAALAQLVLIHLVATLVLWLVSFSGA